MMRFRPILVLLLLLLVAPLMAEQDQLSRQEARDILREELRAVERAIGLFVRGDIPAFREYLAPIGQQRYTEDQMERAHGIMERMFGGHRHTQAAFGTSPPLSHATRGAIVPIDLRNGEVDIHIGWSGNFGPGTISYFRIATRRERPSYAAPPRRIRENQEISSPPYVYPDLFKETEIRIPRRRLEDGRALLAVPNAEISARRLPAALIIGELHSSGPDSARGYLRPLRDIARGLASQGVVTLRIEPRNPRDRGWELESHRLSDMREGLRYLYNHDRVDPAKIYIVGHEIGGIMAAALAREIKLIAGVVLVGTPHSWTPQAEQTRSQKWHDMVGYPTEEELAVLRGERSLLRDGQMPPTSLWSGYPWHFWEDLGRRDTIALMTGFERRLLHISLTESFIKDLMGSSRWKLLGETLPRATFRELNLGYWMAPVGEEGDTPEVLDRRDHVSLELVDTIADWLKLTDTPR